jgi:tetratricopeptide (TPR) repeat protein
MNNASKLFMTIFVLAVLIVPVRAQSQFGWVMPLDSPAATVAQTIGVTDITVKYHRPVAKGRKVFGGLEPYGKVWRAGANDATTIAFSTDVKIEGQPLAAGTYALFMIPTETEWTIIFNKMAKQWGAFNYKEADDALRIKVTPTTAEHQEALQYSFPTATNDATQLVMHWDKLKVAFMISADLPALTKARARKVFNETEAWWAANYYFRTKTDLEEGLRWVNASLALNPGNAPLQVSAYLLKANILGELKRYDEAIQTAELSLPLTAQLRNPAAAKASVEKVIADLKKLKG